MGIQVTATCEWCNKTVTTDVNNPVPEGWITETVKSPDPRVFKPQESVFCDKWCKDIYKQKSPEAHEYAAEQYIGRFYSQMNSFKEEIKKPEPKVATNG